MPLVIALVSPTTLRIPLVFVSSIGFLSLLGALGAYAGGASTGRGAVRVTFWGILAMALTAVVGALFGANV
jgi:VIT1/CCC1 family predicted Fe2+/Mn2+ transporter